ncbi:Aldo/keto reductase [Candidatus Sulfobium mesophilum]|uniref:Aldo/keto reductase n=1 Tax=Candidatus Sulfobium mesophilum TaxID=2016548 RepID=A0A2U3QKE5_9BACT|nr:Aldo/keto reductase [Candidatus Sulfobium mesophilum]
MKRRDFLKAAAFTAAAVTVPPLKGEAVSNTPSVKSYREIGKTGLKMSDISFGAGKLSAASMVLRAIDSGINYFDTAPDYGQSEKTIGEAMAKIKRDKVIITSKLCTPQPYPGHLPLGTKKKDYIASVEGSLSRMKTDYLDFCFVHAIGEMNKDLESEKKRLLSDEMFEAVADLKKAGKVRFLGTSSHGPNNMEELLMIAVKSGSFDVIQPSFNFMKFPKLPEVMKEAHKRGIGVIAMKTLAGAKDMKVEGTAEEFSHAAFKWVLKHPEVSGLIVTMKTASDIELYLKASGAKFTAADKKILDQYAGLYGSQYCRTGCGECERLCPLGVEIASVMRYRMYFMDYGMEKRAMESYALLKRNAAACINCADPACVGSCPHGLPVKEMLCDAHESMSFSA